MITTPSGKVILEDDEEVAAKMRELGEIAPYLPTTLTEEEVRTVRESCPCEMPGIHRSDCKLFARIWNLAQKRKEQAEKNRP